MHQSEPASVALKGLAEFLSKRRDAILTAWRRRVDSDPELTTASTITRAQFIDHIPAVLDAFGSRLVAQHPADREEARNEEKQSAAEHGLQSVPPRERRNDEPQVRQGSGQDRQPQAASACPSSCATIPRG